MAKIAKSDEGRFREDVASVLSQSGGREAVSVLLDAVRGARFSPHSPASGRRWRGIGTLANFERILEEVGGFSIERDRRDDGVVLRMYVGLLRLRLDAEPVYAAESRS